MDAVSKLKQELGGEIVVPASFQLVRTLMEHDLVDELRLKMFPVVLGAGERLFGETSDKKPMRPSTPGPSRATSSSSPTRSSGRPSPGLCQSPEKPRLDGASRSDCFLRDRQLSRGHRRHVPDAGCGGVRA